MYDDKTAFTTGILLFKNCEKMKNLFKVALSLCSVGVFAYGIGYTTHPMAENQKLKKDLVQLREDYGDAITDQSEMKNVIQENW